MHFSSIDAVYFSPTGTTKRVLEAIATGLGLENVTLVDLTMVRNDRILLVRRELIANLKDCTKFMV